VKPAISEASVKVLFLDIDGVVNSAWLARHPRFVFHFTPTSASWLNAVEGFFAKRTRRRLKRGVFRSIVDLQAAINRFLKETNDHPKPFVWTADPDKIIAAVRRGYQALDAIQ
jgi:hypothetical protein